MRRRFERSQTDHMRWKDLQEAQVRCVLQMIGDHERFSHSVRGLDPRWRVCRRDGRPGQRMINTLTNPRAFTGAKAAVPWTSWICPHRSDPAIEVYCPGRP